MPTAALSCAAEDDSRPFTPFRGLHHRLENRVRRTIYSRRLRLESLEDRWLLASGDLDLSFGVDGRVLTDIGQAGSNDYGQDVVAVQSDGKIVVVGHTGQPLTGDDFAITRYSQDGSLDTSFGGDGTVTVDISGNDDRAYGVALDGDHIVVAGYASLGGPRRHDFAVARLNSTGELDSSFGVGGVQTVDFGDTIDYCYGLALDGNDVVLAGYSAQPTGYDFAVARLTSDGQPDLTFGTGGTQLVDFGNAVDYGYDVAVDGSNLILVGETNHGSDYDFAIARLDSEGQLDSSFGTAGIQTVDFGSTVEHARSVAMNGSNIVVAGWSSQGGSTGSDFAVARLNSSGDFDSSFGVGGKQLVHLGSVDEARCMALDDSSMVLAGASHSVSTGFDFAVARLDSSGQLDTLFGAGGWQRVDFGNTFDFAYGVAVDGNNIVLAGQSNQGGATGYDLALARLLINSAPTADANGPYVGDEGLAITFDAAHSTDPEGDDLQFRWDFQSDGTWDTGWLTSPTTDHTWPDDWQGTVTLEVTDGEFADIATASVLVSNAGALLDNVSVSSPVGEGSATTLTGQIIDPGSLDTFTLDIAWGDGDSQNLSLPNTPINSGGVTWDPVTRTFSIEHTYQDNGEYTTTMTVTDDDGDVRTDTFEGWNGTSAVTGFGETDQFNPVATLGQTFATGRTQDLKLADFSFYLKGPETLDFEAFVMEWDGAKAMGPVLYQSSPRATTNSGVFEKFTFAPDDVTFQADRAYVVFLSASQLFDGINGLGIAGSRGDDPLASGMVVSARNGADFGSLTATDWSRTTNSDLVLEANFSGWAEQTVRVTNVEPQLANLSISSLGRRGPNHHAQR